MRQVKQGRRVRQAASLAGALLALFSASSHAQPISFKKTVLPLLQRNCVSCHMTGEEQGGLGLAPTLAYGSLVGKPSAESAMPRVAPRQPERSYLLHKLRGTHLDNGGSGGRMPLGLQPLADDEIAQLAAWIEAGAPNN
ncbi:MAG TPA: c-type cytochrome [Noviherbaspirillum sp.]|uniref:c-type cytochrome n=1 Tax=Noviherbaspirillum sp. TaxID=1926288 RepID=UPI002B486383|nr:c-type cytochrome [Noviherbaspirillum sp.]HJV84514.1 c-type cytochrome [Noviherbaspirillum sp.]